MELFLQMRPVVMPVFVLYMYALRTQSIALCHFQYFIIALHIVTHLLAKRTKVEHSYIKQYTHCLLRCKSWYRFCWFGDLVDNQLLWLSSFEWADRRYCCLFGSGPFLECYQRLRWGAGICHSYNIRPWNRRFLATRTWYQLYSDCTQIWPAKQ